MMRRRSENGEVDDGRGDRKRSRDGTHRRAGAVEKAKKEKKRRQGEPPEHKEALQGDEIEDTAAATPADSELSRSKKDKKRARLKQGSADQGGREDGGEQEAQQDESYCAQTDADSENHKKQKRVKDNDKAARAGRALEVKTGVNGGAPEEAGAGADDDAQDKEGGTHEGGLAEAEAAAARKAAKMQRRKEERERREAEERLQTFMTTWDKSGKGRPDGPARDKGKGAARDPKRIDKYKAAYQR